MRARSIALLSILTIVASMFGITTATAGGPITIMVDDDGMAVPGNCGSTTVTHDTIQEAVDAALAGDTISVCPGDYPDPVNVDKTLEILGAQAGVDARTRPGTLSLESAVGPEGESLLGFFVTAPNVVISGFMFIGWSDAVRSTSEAASLRVLDSIFSENFAGLRIQSNNSLARRNLFADNFVGILMLGGTKALFTLNDFLGNDVGIDLEGDTDDFTGQGEPPPINPFPTDVRILRNEFLGPDLGPGEVGTNTISQTVGIEASSTTGLIITENTISEVLIGIWLAGGTDATTVELNDVSAFDVDLLLDDGGQISTTDVCCAPNSNVTVKSNRLTNSGSGIAIFSLTGSMVVSRNTITGNNGGIFNDSGAQVNAAENWWGAASGPSDWSTGTGDPVSPDVRFFPWSTNATFTAFSKCKNTPTAANQTINGTTGNDILCGGGGQDTIDGKAGNDLILGDAGSDILMGALGADAILGGQGDDTLNGNAGFDHLQGQSNSDSCLVGVDGGQTATCEGP